MNKLVHNQSWIWCGEQAPERNAHVAFRRKFTVKAGQRVRLHLSADSRYVLWINGTRLGIGPARAWPNHWERDLYDLTEYCNAGENTVAVLVIHYGEGTMQYIPSQPGLTADIEIDGGADERTVLCADENWEVRPASGYLADAPRMCLQMAFEEQYDARSENQWWGAESDGNTGWKAAVKVAPPHGPLRDRSIPQLSSEEVPVAGVCEMERVCSTRYHWTLNLRPYCCPHEKLSAPMIYKGYLFTQIKSPEDQEVHFIRPHWYHQGPMYLNGEEIPRLESGFARAPVRQSARLVKGWNRLIVPLPDVHFEEAGISFGVGLFPQFSMDVETPLAVVWSAKGGASAEATDRPFAFLGPFHFTEGEAEEIRARIHNYVVASPRWFPEGATAEACPGILDDVKGWNAGEAIDAEQKFSSTGEFFRPMSEIHTLADDVFLQAITDQPGEQLIIPEDTVCRLSGEGEGFEITPPKSVGESIRFLVDFGEMIIGDHEFDVEAHEGTIIDFHNFEFIQRNGRKNYAEDMNNTLRYTCREGRQSYRSVIRRGFQYSWVIVRNATGPVRFHGLSAHFVAYPQSGLGQFECSDPVLNKIWKVGAHTLRCCSEDTYTDCPTYEQVFWVGDGRNEALVDWMVNGDPRLWFRCLRLAGESLERSAITESHVPSADRSILPAWNFLWMRSCREYLLYTGDFARSGELLQFLKRNFKGLQEHLNADGLFEIHAWNMFDWAEMDTPDEGVVTHNNCFLVLALNESAEFSEWMGDSKFAEEVRALARGVRDSINRHLWDESKGAYVDCIHKDGKPSSVFSQQTQTVALRAGVPDSKERSRLCRSHVFNPPEGFVRSGSPFFQFFVLEILAQESQSIELLDSIRENWGFMIDEGATTFWEMWSLRGGRLTRSHCHGWSAAPTYFLSQEVLGIHPVAPGFAKIRIAPKLGHLKEAQGTVPTPNGLIKVHYQRSEGGVTGTVDLPEGIVIAETEGVDLLADSIA